MDYQRIVLLPEVVATDSQLLAARKFSDQSFQLNKVNIVYLSIDIGDADLEAL